MNAITGELKRLRRTIAEAADNRDATGYFDAWREVLVLYRAVNRDRTNPEPKSGEGEYRKLWELAGEAFLALGGQAEASFTTLDRYDHLTYGPMLGVSDEGSAAAAIRRGALASPKCALLNEHTPLTVGVAHDAERLGAIGEVVVGPQEFRDIRLACMGRILTTTNVGTRVNLRNYADPPLLKIKSDSETDIVAVLRKLKQLFEPYWKTPSGRSRRLTVLLQFDDHLSPHEREAVFKTLRAALAVGDICNPRSHRVGLSVRLPGASRLGHAKAAVELARQCDLDEVALDGRALPVSGDVISLPGLLTLFEPDELEALLAFAAKQKVHVEPQQRVDPQTTARHVWAGLTAARHMGLDLGKYGLLPLTFEQQKEVIARIQLWMKNWCAAPVCYIDYPIVTRSKVYFGASLSAGIKRWLDMVHSLHVHVVLIDTARKAEGRYILKHNAQDERGIFSLDEIDNLNQYAENLKIKALWAGGISIAQAHLFGKLGVFGVYVTSAAAKLQRLSRRARFDPGLAAEREPQPESVARVKLLLEAGFLVGQFGASGLRTPADQLEATVQALLNRLGNPTSKRKDIKRLEAEVYEQVASGWSLHFGARKGQNC